MRLIDADALYDTFERTPWMDNADRDIAEELADSAPTVSPWVKTSDRLPTEADADNTMCWVLATTISSNPPMPEAISYIRANPDNYPYWMPIPPLPEKDEQEPWPGDDLDCPNCGQMLEHVAGGKVECPVCGFFENDTAEENDDEL